MSTDDYVKYMTETFIKHLERPRSERKDARKKRKEEKGPFLFNWFGLIPFSLMMLVKKDRGE
ncbi:YqzE family protein [Siminovitchia sp. 179-K 8D1 HS]|uniref:YqzE family protein n=1 Tax=Siminovitchia sp. 179-K 8D1 HS TaxID=3142385 RepID=UPI0039A2EF6E